MYNGDRSYSQRNVTVAQFDSDPTIRVLLTSDAGSAGLNLNTASSVIVWVSLSSAAALKHIESADLNVHRMGSGPKLPPDKRRAAYIGWVSWRRYMYTGSQPWRARTS